MPPRITITSKKASNKSSSELNFVQKSPHVRMSISPRVEQENSKDWYGWNIIFYWNCKLHSIYGSTPLKIRIISKKSSNKSSSKLNFVQKSSQAHMSIPLHPKSGARGLDRLIWLKYNFALKLQITFSLGLNAAKNTHYIKKSIK